MHRAKHRSAGRAGGEVSAASLIERFAGVPGPRHESGGPRHGVATLPAPAGPVLFGAAPHTAPMLAVDGECPRDASALFGGEELFCGTALDDDGGLQSGDSPLFGASRHARTATALPAPRVPAPKVPALPFPVASLKSARPQPVGAALSLTVFGAAAAVTAVIAPQPTSLVETTGSLAPVERTAPVPAPAVGPVLAAAPAQAALPDRPTVHVGELVTEVTSEMQRVEPAKAPFVTVANSTALTSPAAVRKAALTTALGKLGTPYRWGAMGPNAFDCSGLVKWSFANAGKKLPRTSRAMASVGIPVKKADLQPGDLVFFYQPISHVGIYMGNGKIVHASRSGQPVKVSDMARMRFTTARRI